MLSGNEKIWYLVSLIEDELELASDNDEVGIKKDLVIGKYDQLDLRTVFEKLEQANAAKLVGTPVDQNWMRYMIKVLPDFNRYVEKLEENPEYLEWSGKKPKPKNYFDPERRVDFSKSKEENKDKYISVGQIEELMNMPKDKRAKIEKDSLTQEHLDDIKEFQDGLKQASEKMKKQVEGMLDKIRLPRVNIPDLAKFNEPSTVEMYAPPNYQAQSVGLLKQLVEQKNNEDKPNNNTVLTITYTGSRQVVLNDFLELSHPTLNGTNDLVFNHLYNNPRKAFSKKQLEKAIGKTFSKTLHKIVENLGFKGDLAKAFFTVSKNDILFRNPITRDELNEMGLGFLKISR